MAGAPLASQQATFDASGNAQTAPMGPAVYGSRWNVDRMVVSTSSVLITSCDVYRNTVQPSNKVDSTRTGNSDVSETNIDIRPPDALVFVWTGGTPGAVATAVVSGTLYTGR